jgi:hypothetical protein
MWESCGNMGIGLGFPRAGHVSSWQPASPIRTRRLRGDDTGLNTLNKRLMETIQAEGVAFLTNTTLRGRFALRACVLHYDTTAAAAPLLDAVRALGVRE